MFIRNGTLFNIDAQHEIDGVQYPAGYFRDPYMRTAFAVTETPDPVRPDDRFHFVSQNPDGTFTAVPRPLDDLKAAAVAGVKLARRAYLDRFAPSPGITAVYDENLLAATRLLAGDTTAMRNGETPTSYLAAMGSRFGMAAAAFAAYVVAENQAAALKAAAVERVYLDYAYVIIPAATFESIQTIEAACLAALEQAIAS